MSDEMISRIVTKYLISEKVFLKKYINEPNYFYCLKVEKMLKYNC
jgi:hypothetical protein